MLSTKGKIKCLKKIYNELLFESGSGERISICMRDTGFEIAVKDMSSKKEKYKFYSIQKGEIKEIQKR